MGHGDTVLPGDFSDFAKCDLVPMGIVCKNGVKKSSATYETGAGLGP